MKTIFFFAFTFVIFLLLHWIYCFLVLVFFCNTCIGETDGTFQWGKLRRHRAMKGGGTSFCFQSLYDILLVVFIVLFVIRVPSEGEADEIFLTCNLTRQRA